MFIQYPTFLIAEGGPAAWQTALIMTVVALVLLLPLGALANRFPGKGLFQISEEVAGPAFGGLLTLCVALYFFANVVNGVRNFTETYIGTILPNTPPSVLTLVSVACLAYASYRGLESISRTVMVLLPVILAGVLLVLVFSLPRLNASRVYPFWGHGLLPNLASGAYYSGMAGEALLALAVGYGFREGKLVRRSALLGVLLFGLLTSLTVAVLVMIFGAPDAAQQPFPMFNLSQLVYLGRFLQRTEALIVMFWFFNVVVRLAALFHTTVVTVTGMLNLPYYRPLIFPIGVLVVAMSLLPQDTVTVLRIMRDWLTPSGIVVLLIPLLLLILAMIRGKGGQADAT
ncbi:MAG: GerAB/ArcD/ProY family transporter [Bacteroidota bacterium]